MYKSITTIIAIALWHLCRHTVLPQGLSLDPSAQFYNPGPAGAPGFNRFPGTPMAGQLYNGHNLSPFGSLAFSIGRVCDIRLENDPEYQKCRQEAVVDWGSTTYPDRQIKYLCCYTWDVIDCMETAVQYRCSRSEFDFEDYYRNYAIRKEELRNSLERFQCVDYPYRSIRCHFFWWAIVLIVLAIFIVIVVVAAICYRLLRAKKGAALARATDVKVHR